MAWIESHQQLGRHPKLLKLAGQLRIHRAQALGHLHFLWWWALDYAPYGDVSALTSAEIAAASEWPGDVAQFDNSLRECGWIDSNGHLHDWMEYAGKLVEKRRLDRDRKRFSIGIPLEVHRNSIATVPKPTQPNHTQPNSLAQPGEFRAEKRKKFEKPTAEQVNAYGESIGFKIDGSSFLDFYESKGWLIGKNPMRNWQAAVRTWKKNQNYSGGGLNGTKRASERVTGLAGHQPGKYDAL